MGAVVHFGVESRHVPFACVPEVVQTEGKFPTSQIKHSCDKHDQARYGCSTILSNDVDKHFHEGIGATRVGKALLGEN